MKTQVARRLLRLNAEFYQRFAEAFAESRRVASPGLQRALAWLAPAPSILDLGCGDGRAAQTLAGLGWQGEYTGVEASPAMLARARARELGALRARFARADLADRGWPAQLSRQSFGGVALFAVLHHIPGARRRARLLRQAAALLAPGGRAAVSTWQFLGQARLERKIVPWQRAGLQAGEVDPGDYLLDWQRGGAGLRYVCALDEPALGRMARAAGLQVEEAYRADGRTGALSLFVLLRRPA